MSDYGILGGVLGSIGGAMQMGATQRQNRENIKLMKQSWKRDDTAVQRRTKDLEAAGINPVLAAGSAAGNSGAIKLESEDPSSMMTGAVEGAQSGMDIARTQASVDLTRAQARKANAEADMMTQTWTDPEGNATDWGKVKLLELWGPAYSKGMSNIVQRYELENTEKGKVDIEKFKQDFMLKHQQELMRIELELKKQGLTGKRLENEKVRQMTELIKLERKWYPWKTGAGVVSQAVGTTAKTIVGHGLFPY